MILAPAVQGAIGGQDHAMLRASTNCNELVVIEVLRDVDRLRMILQSVVDPQGRARSAPREELLPWY